jgi:hypothetical protein
VFSAILALAHSFCLASSHIALKPFVLVKELIQAAVFGHLSSPYS